MRYGDLMSYCKYKTARSGIKFKCSDCRYYNKECATFKARYNDSPGMYLLKYTYKDNGMRSGKAYDIYYDSIAQW